MSGPSNYNQTVIEAFRQNGGNVQGWDRLLLLTATGTRSGQPRTTPLAYFADGERLIVIASNGGAPANPDWYHNLLANPIVTVELGSERFQARPIVADGQERERLYARYAELMPGIDEHQKKTSRTFPVVILERLS